MGKIERWVWYILTLGVWMWVEVTHDLEWSVFILGLLLTLGLFTAINKK